MSTARTHRTTLFVAVLCGCTAHQAKVDDPHDPKPILVDPIAEPDSDPGPEPVIERLRCFEDARSFPFSFRPLTAAIGDVDGDGDDDIVAVSSTSQAKIAVALGDGAGSFEDIRTIDGPSNALAPNLGDFNGDGNVDLVTTNSELGTVSFLEGNGDGDFRWVKDTPVRKWVGQGVAADFDDDGRLDLAVPLWSAIRVLGGDGTGGFAARQTIRTGQAPERPILLDVNRDEALDLVIPSNDAHQVSVLLRKQRGKFGREHAVRCGEGATRVAAGDFDGDGAADLATPNMHSDSICVFRGDGHGAFAVKTELEVGHVTTIAVSDVDEDGRDDLITYLGRLEVLGNNGDWGFPTLTYDSGGSGVRDLWSKDVNGDGRADVVSVMSGVPGVVVWLGRKCDVAG